MSFFGSTNFLFEVAKGNVPGHVLFNIVAANFDVDTGATEDVWVPGGTMVYPTANEAWEVVSDNVNDTSAGTGAQKVKIIWQDSNYIVQAEEEVTLNGTTAVPLVGTNSFRTHGFKVSEVGSGGENAGTIILRKISGSVDRDGISPGENLTSNSHRTIPAGQTGHLFLVAGFVGKNKDILVRQRRTEGNDGIFATTYGFALYQSSLIVPLLLPGGPVIEKSDIKMTCETENNNTAVGVTLQLLLVDNP